MCSTKCVTKTLAVLVMLPLFGCATYSFGNLRYLPSDANPKYSVYARITPLEWPGAGIRRKAAFQIDIVNEIKRKRLVKYKKTIYVTNLEYNTRMENGRILVDAVERYEPHSRWSFVFVETSVDHFDLAKEEGKFLEKRRW